MFFLPSDPVLTEGRELPVNLILLDVMDLDAILGMEWLSQHYAIVDCRRREVIFRTPNVEEFKLWVTRVLHLRILSPLLLLERC